MIVIEHRSRFEAAAAAYKAARGIEADRHWRALLLLVTATESLWQKMRPYIDFPDGSAYLDQLRQEVDLSGGEVRLMDLAQHFFNRGVRKVDLTELADTLDGNLWPVVLAALAIYRGEE